MAWFESFESRRLLSASAPIGTPLPEVTARVSKTGTLNIVGSAIGDRIHVGYAEGRPDLIQITANGTVAWTTDKVVKRVAVRGAGGKDRVVVDLKASVAARLVGGAGKDTLIVVNAPLAPLATPVTIELKGAEAFTPAPPPNPSWRPAGEGETRAWSFLTYQGVGDQDLPFVQLLTGVDVSLTAPGPSAEGTDTIYYWKTADLKTRAKNPSIVAGTFPVATVNAWFDADTAVFSPGHTLRRFGVAEPGDGSVTTYVYDPDAGTVTVAVVGGAIADPSLLLPPGYGFQRVDGSTTLRDLPSGVFYSTSAIDAVLLNGVYHPQAG